MKSAWIMLCLSTLGANADAPECIKDGTALEEDAFATNLLQHSIGLTAMHPGPESSADGKAMRMSQQLSAAKSCAVLKNQGSFFTVPITVGTPEPGTKPQVLEVVADTGSSATMVASCSCEECKIFNPHGKCFHASNRSKTFSLSGPGDGDSVLGVSVTYGSGTVQAVIASDRVELGGKSVVMQDGVLLMVNRMQLPVVGPFEGILGLGPKRVENENMLAHAASGAFSVMDTQNQTHRNLWPHQQYQEKLFMERAGVERYSLCFNDAGKPGALRMDLPPLTDALPAIGNFHWGLGLYGLSVGSQDATPIFCGSSALAPNQTTPCAAIPDSGTTLMLGPKRQVQALFGSICDAWPRCQQEKSSGSLKNLSKADAFQKLLFECDSWMSDSNSSIDEVPSVFFTMGGQGQTRVVELSAWAYVTETVEDDIKKITKHLFGVLPVDILVPSGRRKKVCTPSFGVMQYDTKANGPVWLLGTPLFYEYVVNYDLSAPSMSFSREPCAACSETAPSFLSSRQQARQSMPRRARAMRKAHGAPRVPIIDTTLPL